MTILNQFVSHIHRLRGPSCIIVSQSNCLDVNRQYQNVLVDLKCQIFFVLWSQTYFLYLLACFIITCYHNHCRYVIIPSRDQELL